MPQVQLVIVDIAGTIIEDRGEVVRAFADALTRGGIQFSHSELEEWKGASKREVIRHFVRRQFTVDRSSDQKIAEVYENFRRLLESHYETNGVIPIAGAEDTFEWLRQRGILVATTTGFYREVSELVLRKAGWQNTFAANVSSSDVHAGRPAPDMIFRVMEAAGIRNPDTVVNVGDTPLDLQAGKNAGVRGVIGVLTGLHKRERLQREPHTQILSSIAELPALIKREYV